MINNKLSDIGEVYFETIPANVDLPTMGYSRTVEFHNWLGQPVIVNERIGGSRLIQSSNNWPVLQDGKPWPYAGYFVIVLSYRFSQRAAEQTLTELREAPFDGGLNGNQFRLALETELRKVQSSYFGGAGDTINFKQVVKFNYDDFKDHNFNFMYSPLDLHLGLDGKFINQGHPHRDNRIGEDQIAVAQELADQLKSGMFSVRYVLNNQSTKKVYTNVAGYVKSFSSQEEPGTAEGIYIVDFDPSLGIAGHCETRYIELSKFEENGFFETREMAEARGNMKLHIESELEKLKIQNTFAKVEGEAVSIAAGTRSTVIKTQLSTFEAIQKAKHANNAKREEMFKKDRDDKVGILKYLTDLLKLFPGLFGAIGKLLEMFVSPKAA